MDHDEAADFLVERRHLGGGDLPNVEQFLDECRQDWMILREHPCSLGEGSFVATAHDQTEGLQNASDLTVDLDPDVDEPTANAERPARTPAWSATMYKPWSMRSIT